MAEGEDEGLWCRRCGQRAEFLGGGDGEDAHLRRAVHSATGDERGGPEGHLAAPIDYEPALWKAARELSAEFGGRFTFTARLGVLRADVADPPPGVTPRHYTADGPRARELLRGRLRNALIASGIDPPLHAEEATLP